MHEQPQPLPTPGSIFYDRERIATRVRELGEQVSADYAGRVPVLVTVLKGATVFVSDLARAMTVDHEMDFLALSAYGDDAQGLHARILKDVSIPIEGREVLLVEDVVDTGLTLRFILRYLATHDPAAVRVCTLLDRPHRRLVDERIHYRGFVVPDRFFVGYGFDYCQRYRNLPDLHELDLETGLAEQLMQD